MSENQGDYEPSSQSVARSLAGREVGKTRNKLGELQERAFDNKLNSDLNNARNVISTSDDEFEKQEAVKSIKEVLAALSAKKQGEFETNISKTKNDNEKGNIQRAYSPELKQKTAELIFDENGRKINFTPLDSIHDIALIENEVYDQTLSKDTKKSDIDLTTQVDNVMNRIGRNYLKGEIIPGSIGDHFKDQAIKEIGKYTIGIRQKNQLRKEKLPTTPSSTTTASSAKPTAGKS